MIDGSPDNSADIITDYHKKNPTPASTSSTTPTTKASPPYATKALTPPAATGSPSSTQTTNITPNSSKNFTRRRALTMPTSPYAGIPSDTATVPKCTGQKLPPVCTKAKILPLSFWKTATPGLCAIKSSVPSYLMGYGSPKTFIAPKMPSSSSPAA